MRSFIFLLAVISFLLSLAKFAAVATVLILAAVIFDWRYWEKKNEEAQAELERKINKARGIVT